MSKREAPVAIISMAQQARPNVIGHMLDSRAQLIACSSDVVMTFSSLPNPSSHPISQLLERVCDQEPIFAPTSWRGSALTTDGNGATPSELTLRTQARSPRFHR